MAIELLQDGDIDEIVAAFAALGWPGKDHSQYRRYLAEQESGDRVILVARQDGVFAGYGTVAWASDYPPFRQADIPELQDLNVLPRFRRHGIGTAIMDEAEACEATRSAVGGVGVGLYSDYGAAQRMYVVRGYVPDGLGISYGPQAVEPGETVRVDDGLCLWLTRQLR